MYWDPFDEMQQEMNRIFSSYKSKLPERAASQPAMDMMDNGKEIVVILDLPGVDKRNIQIDCDGKFLQISAKSSAGTEEKKEGYYFAERSASSFSRGVSLPTEVIPEKAKSTFKNGVLEIRLPKREAKAGKRGHRIRVD